MYIEKKNIGGLKYCEGCPYFKLKIENRLFEDSELCRILVTCAHYDICSRINIRVCKEKLMNDVKKKGE